VTGARLSDVIRKNTHAFVQDHVFLTNGVSRKFTEESDEAVEFAE